MVLAEEKAQIDDRLTETLRRDYKHLIPEYYEALEIASKCIDAQMRLADVLNEFWDDAKPTDSFSGKLVYNILEQFRFDYEPDDIWNKDDGQGAD